MTPWPFVCDFAKSLKNTFASLGSLNIFFTTSKLKSHLGGLKASVPKPLRSHWFLKLVAPLAVKLMSDKQSDI